MKNSIAQVETISESGFGKYFLCGKVSEPNT